MASGGGLSKLGMKLLVATKSERAAHMLGADARLSANDGELSEADLQEIDREFAISKARDCREFIVDRSREEAAARVEMDQRRAQGLPW
jgi:hypothetical protein